MTMKTSSIVGLGNRSGRRTRRPRRQRQPAPGPVVIVRPASVAATRLTPVQQARRADAQQLAAGLTEDVRRGLTPRYERGFSMYASDIPQAATILRDAPAIAAAPPAGGVRVGRDRYGRAVALVVHAERWSLVVHPTHDPDYPLVSWAFIDGYGEDLGLTHIAFCFDNDSGLAGVAWSDMLATVLAGAT